MLYTDAGYYLDTHDGRNILTVTAGERKAARVNLGVRFDTEEMVALQANVTHRPDTRVPLELELTGRLGKRMTARVGAALRPLSYGSTFTRTAAAATASPTTGTRSRSSR